MIWKSKINSDQDTPMETKSPTKAISIGVLWFLGISIGIAHIGVLGHLMKMSNNISNPVINIPSGEYSSYELNVSKDGYSVKYRANDPKVLSSERSLELDRTKKGIFGGGTETRNEYRKDEYTAEGYRNIQGGALDEEGKSAREIECIVADAGARSQGAIAGTSIATGALAPAVINIPYIGWLAAGWMALLGQRVGSAVGSEVGSIVSDC
jgi:hypothetical protein